MREYASNALLVALSMAFLWHFYFIVRHKTVVIQEPNPIILVLEVAAIFGCLVLGVVNMARVLREHRS